MSIRHAVLGLIAEEPRHGYAVRAAFEERVGDFWELNFGQVYQVLSALEKEGLIVGTGQQVGRRPRRTVYSVTARGRDALTAWLAQPLSPAKPFRDDFYVRLLFIDENSAIVLSRLLKMRVVACEQRLAELLDERHAHTQDRSDPKKRARWLFTEAAVFHAEADLKAAELCSRVLGADDAAQRISSERATERSRRRGAP